MVGTDPRPSPRISMLEATCMLGNVRRQRCLASRLQHARGWRKRNGRPESEGHKMRHEVEEEKDDEDDDKQIPE